MNTLFNKSGPALLNVFLAACLAAGLASCAYPIRNVQAAQLNAQPGLPWYPESQGETLIIVTASGGGTRAASLALSTFRALASVRLQTGEPMADAIDVVSSVSGGSVAAGYFALAGTAGLNVLEHDFVRQPGMRAIIGRGLNPIELAKLSTPGTERIDLLIDYLDRQLFNDATFATLLDGKRRPFLILNAGDMVEGTPFSFTYYTFDLLCSDLRQLKLSTAVAASAAFPVALSPVTLKNYSHCPAQPPLSDGWPPPWVKFAAHGTAWDRNPGRVMRGRVAEAYALGQDKAFIHLLDGGIVDNLGMIEPFRLLTTVDVSPKYLTRISQGQIKRILWIVVNARSAPPSGLDHAPDTPGIGQMFMGTVSSAIDSRTSASLYQIKEALVGEWAKYAATLGPAFEANFQAVADHTFVASVDFDAISDTGCRQRFHSISTSWTLSGTQVDALLSMGTALLLNDTHFKEAARDMGATLPASVPTIAAACQMLPAEAQSSAGSP